MADAHKYTGKLANQHVLVTGGTSGIGFGLAEALLENDAHAYISSSNPKRVQDAISKLQQSYPSKKASIHGFVCNLGDETALESNIQQLFEEVAKAVPEGKLDHVVHCAGDSLAMMPVDAWTMEKVKKAAVVRFWSPLFIAKTMRGYVKSGPHSSFTLTTGGVSQKPIANWSVVACYAGGLHAMARNLAIDLKPIRVNLVSPGAVDTELWGAAREQIVKDFGVRTLTGKIGQVEDVVESYLYLMKDENATGSCVSTNSGGILL